MNGRPLIIGHRGASALAPENTLAAFRRALADGADGFEFDVRLTRDQELVVIHDATLKRTAKLNLKVSQATKEDLNSIDVGSWFNEKHNTLSGAEFRSERIPALRTVFEEFGKRGAVFFLEMKGPPWQNLAPKVVQLIKIFEMYQLTIVECFHLPALAQIKRLDPKVRTAALFQPSVRHPLSTLQTVNLIKRARNNGVDEVALHHRLVRQRTVTKALELEMPCTIWTVDDPDWLERAASLGLKAVITNNPALMKMGSRPLVR